MTLPIQDEPESTVGRKPHAPADQPAPPRREAGRPGTHTGPGRRDEERGEPEDPREEEGWTQPESSAQKGAPPDEG